VLLGFLLLGCETTQNIKETISSKVKPFMSKVDEELYAQVPEENRKGVAKAESNLAVFEGKAEFVTLKRNLAVEKKRYADYELHLANNYKKESEIGVDIAKLKAIQKSGLGEKEDIMKKIASLESKKLKVAAERVEIDTEMATTKMHIQQLTKQIEDQG
jgi:hypothetical protein